MTVLHLAGSLSRNAGGLYYSVRKLCQHLHKGVVNVQVAGCQDAHFAADAPAWAPVVATVFPAYGPTRFSPALRLFVAESGAQLLHQHGLWLHLSRIAFRCRKQGKTTVVSPRGMLEPWAWRHSAWKKRPIWWLWERRNLASASAIHATSEMEAKNIRALGIQTPIAVIPNGMEMPENLPVKPTDPNRTKQALFVSRIHPKKGLLNLVQAWALVRPQGWRMIVAGPDENNHQAEIQKAVHQAGLLDAFTFPGPVYDQKKFNLYANSDLFILPTFSENFGLVIAEALACGTPVITTTGTPWEELPQNRCGWWIEPTAEALANTLAAAAALADGERQAMGQRGQSLVKDKYAWPKIASEMKSIYEWVLGTGPKPACVV